MYAAFTGQPLEKVQQYTERDRFLSVSEVIFTHSDIILVLCFEKKNHEKPIFCPSETSFDLPNP